jgi:hypothetical protein
MHGAERFQQRLDEIVRADGDAAGGDQDVDLSQRIDDELP